MKRAFRILLICVGILFLLVVTAVLIIFPADRIRTPANIPPLSGPYLGQNPPGKNPRQFAPDIIGEDIHATIIFSPDGNEAYWRPFLESTDEILYMVLENGTWASPQVVPFSSRISDSDDPCFSVDGNRLYFTSWRPLKWWQIIDQRERIWFVEKESQGWTRPTPVSNAVNSMDLHWQVSLSKDETLYFTSDQDIYRSPFQDGAHQEPQKLGTSINTPDYEGHPWIASDESYLLFSSNHGKQDPGDFDLFLSWKSEQGVWGNPVNLGDLINTPNQELYPVLSPDQKYLFFLSNRGRGLGVYWVDFEMTLAGLKDSNPD